MLADQLLGDLLRRVIARGHPEELHRAGVAGREVDLHTVGVQRHVVGSTGTRILDRELAVAGREPRVRSDRLADRRPPAIGWAHITRNDGCGQCRNRDSRRGRDRCTRPQRRQQFGVGGVPHRHRRIRTRRHGVSRPCLWHPGAFCGATGGARSPRCRTGRDAAVRAERGVRNDVVAVRAQHLHPWVHLIMRFVQQRRLHTNS